jgi:hypothetical protein
VATAISPHPLKFAYALYGSTVETVTSGTEPPQIEHPERISTQGEHALGDVGSSGASRGVQAEAGFSLHGGGGHFCAHAVLSDAAMLPSGIVQHSPTHVPPLHAQST